MFRNNDSQLQFSGSTVGSVMNMKECGVAIPQIPHWAFPPPLIPGKLKPDAIAVLSFNSLPTMATMKAVRFHGNQDLRLDEIPVAKVGPDQVKVAPEWCGICGSGSNC